ncbi:MAG: NAD(P)-dependent oxidoreductase [Candidatus Peribacteraceae bacterium]|nr:NAD(P)-dependent oxidoreductase [Candidatus Peribacteraceae bacterium]MDD5742162.1 NAD(P)-dependent oxidoreductase [Candidatus Peribacteraceae bacterium]
MAKITFLEVDPEDAALIKSIYPDALILKENLAGKGVADRCADAEILCCFIYSKITKAELDRLPKLKLLITRSVGFDHIDLTACRERTIVVCHVPDYGSHVIAELVFALLLSTMRHITEGEKRVEGGTFDYHGLKGMTLRGKTLGIVGTGKIGRRVAQVAHGFGMKIVAFDKCRTLELTDLLDVEYVSFEDLLARSDIVTLHLPAIPEAEHMINDAAIARMKNGVILVNTARGSIIDSKALLRGLKSGKIRYALLDVLEHEKNFAENKELIEHPNVVTTPHIGFYADVSVTSMYTDCFESIRQWQAGQTPEHVIHPTTKVCDLPGIKRAG